MVPENLLFEMIVEDLPPTEVEEMMKNFEENLRKEFEVQGLDHGELKIFYTIRRFGFFVKDVADRQKDRMIERRGPSVKSAFDEDGKPTKALEGFLRANDGKMEDIEVRKLKNGEYVFLKKIVEGKLAEEVIPEILKNVIDSLRFRKPMRWGKGKYEFIRPPHHILCMLGNKKLDFEIFGLKSSNFTMGLRFFGSEILLNDVKDYVEKLRENYVLVFPDERLDKIKNEIDEFERKTGLKVQENEELVFEIMKVCEYPKLIHGKFDEVFLNLPAEIITTTLEHHQRAFSVMDREGKLVNSFVAFQDRPGENENIVRGYEKVVNARLEDARFYFEEDLKIPLESRNEELKGMIFQKELGTLFDKVKRIEILSMKICDLLKIEGKDREFIRRAAILSKADTATNLVYEFPELQGKAGRIYALKQGEDERVAFAIEEQYLPSYEDDPIPSDLVGAVIGIADRIDTIVGNFMIGNVPSGSKDPFGLRRKALGIIKIIEGFSWDLDLNEIIEEARRILNVENQGGYDEIPNLFRSRLESYLSSKGIDYDIARAVSKIWNEPLRSIICAEALQKFRDDGKLEDVLIAFERPYNITRNHGSTEYDGALFKEEEERELFNKYMETKEKVESAVEHLNYSDALEKILELKPYIDRYFDNVFVMVGEEDIRLNRLGFLKELSTMFEFFGDLSVVERKNEEV